MFCNFSDSNTDGCVSHSDGGKPWQPALVRKLFDKELDNHHEEALLLAQLAAQQLRKALQCDSCTLHHALVAWAERTAQVSCQARILLVLAAVPCLLDGIDRRMA